MADIKVSEMTEATSVSDNDYIMIVQGGVSKKLPLSFFIKTGETASDSDKLDGHHSSEFLPSDGTAADSDALGGVPASQYAKKSDIPETIDPAWSKIIIWHTNIEEDNSAGSVAMRNANYVVCDGRLLSKTTYSELWNVIGTTYMTAADVQAYPSQFRIPDYRGRMVLFANCVGDQTAFPTCPSFSDITTENLPFNLYHGEHFTSGGQFKVPQSAGAVGGDFTTVQESAAQMANHNHEVVHDALKKTSYTTTGGAGSKTKGVDTWSLADVSTNNRGGNTSNLAQYPHNPVGGNYNYGMLSVPRFITGVAIMKIKP